MSYTKNPYIGRVRRDAADMVRRGFSKEEVGRNEYLANYKLIKTAICVCLKQIC